MRPRSWKGKWARSLLTDRLTEAVALALGVLLRTELREGQKGPKHRTAILEIVREIARLRQGDHEMERMRLQSDRWEMERERILQEDRARLIQTKKDEIRGRIWAQLNRPHLVEALGGGETAEKLVQVFDALDFDTPLPRKQPSAKAEGAPVNQTKPAAPDPTRSSSIKSNQTPRETRGEPIFARGYRREGHRSFLGSTVQSGFHESRACSS